jgi:hypothetical protein
MKAGCSTGACHGALAGQNGFRLSLRGYDDDGDYKSLTRHALSRRINPYQPEKSLILLKATNAIPHKGGERFKVGSPEYQILAEWIAQGTKGPSAADPRISHIELQPPKLTSKVGAEQQLKVVAHFTDGAQRDVTRFARFTSTDGSVLNVDDDGKFKVQSHGEASVTAWFLSKLTTTTITVPFDKPVDPAVFATSKKRNFIDELVIEKLRELNLPPSPSSSDAEFLRRVYLDTIGVLPRPEEARAFFDDASPNRRDKLIEQLLSRPEFVDYWSYKWSDLLLVSSKDLRAPAMWAYYNWVRDNVAANTPWDQFARKLVTARGDTLENGAANFYILHDDPTEISETLSVAMLGMAINCARCHNHPLEKWTNDQYFSMANLFGRVRSKNGSSDGEHIVFAAAQGDVIQPLTGRPQPPAPLDAKPISLEDPQDRREYFADWLVSRDNPYFSRAIVNRVWANYMGVGLVEKVDDMRLTNPASNEKLLNALAAYLADNQFDLKALMRLILQSETYQRSSRALPENARDGRMYSRYYPRRLMAEVLLDAYSQVAGAPTEFAGYGPARALQLPDSNVDSYFLKAFGRADRVQTCECERTADPSMAQALHIANGPSLNEKLARNDNRVAQLLAMKLTDEQLIDEAYLSSLTRYPRPEEKQTILALWKDSKDEKRQLVEDLLWSLLSSNEFLFNH